ncbi:riboflavin synthase [bacterium]
MFTGLVEELGIIERIDTLADGRRFKIQAIKSCRDLKIDDSIAVNGVCLTVTDVQTKSFSATAVQETLLRSTLTKLHQGDFVNLERALLASSRIGGHWVQGHVDAVGKITAIKEMGTGWLISVFIPESLLKYCVEKGSIAMDGISLTIASLSEQEIKLAVIPHTFINTRIKYMKLGFEVNIEVDILAKYVERMMFHDTNKDSHDETWYRSKGF